MHAERSTHRLTIDPQLRQYQVDTLIHWLRYSRPQLPVEEIRLFAAWALGRLQAPGTIPKLIELLEDEHPDIQSAAATTLASFGGRAKTRLTEVMETTDNPDNHSVVQAALDAIDTPSLRRGSQDDRETYWLARAASGAEPRSAAVPRLVTLLRSDDATVRENAAYALGAYGGEPAVTALIAALGDADAGVRATIAEALGRIGYSGAVSALLNALHDPDDMVAEQAAIAIGKVGNSQTVPALIRALRESPPEEGRWLTFALAELRACSLDALIAITYDPDDNVRHNAIVALGLSRDHRAVQPLAAIVRQQAESLEVRAEIVLALRDTGGDIAIDTLRMLLDDQAEHPVIRGLASHAIDKLHHYRLDADHNPRSGPELSDAEREVLRAAHERHRERIGSRHYVVIPWLSGVDVFRQELRSSNPLIRRAAFRHLLSEDVEDLRQEAVNALGYRSASARVHGLYALMENGDPTIIPTFIFNLSAADQSVRRMALRALKHHGDATVAFIIAWFTIAYRGERLVDTNQLNAVNAQFGTELAALLRDPAAVVRRGTALALKRMRDYRAISSLQAAGTDRAVSVQSTVREALIVMRAAPASPVELRQQSIMGVTGFAEVLEPTGIYTHPEQRLVVVTSRFPHGRWPGRDTRFKSIVRQRVSVYDAKTLRCLGVMDESRYIINDIAIHPRLPLIAIATGEYDGGLRDDGNLLLWNIETGHVRSLLSYDGHHDGGPEVTRCSFDDVGNTLEIILRPWDDVEEERTGVSFYRLVVSFDDWLAVRDRDVRLEFADREPLPALSGDEGYRRQEPAAVRQELDTLAAAAGKSFEERWGIWDLGWAGEQLLVTRNQTALERWVAAGNRPDVIASDLDGMQLLVDERHGVAWVNQYGGRKAEEDEPDWPARVTRIDLHTLDQTTVELASTPTILSRAASGHVLARGLRDIFADQDTVRFGDMIITPEGDVTELRALGHYDSCNSYLRIDGTSHLYYLPTIPLTLVVHRGRTREMPHIHRFDPLSHEVERLFPLEWNTERNAHFFSRSAIHVTDDLGQALILSCEVYRPRYTDPHVAFLQRRRIPDGAVIWETRTAEPVIAMVAIPTLGITLAAMGDGYLATYRNTTGTILTYDDVRIDGTRTPILSLAATGETIAAGAIDGRIIIYALSVVLSRSEGPLPR